MWIRQFAARNFRSLRDVRMDELGNLVTIVGENGSDKTNIVEAICLFMREFDDTLRRPCGELPTQLWHCEATDTPIELAVTLELTEEEQADVVGKELLRALGPVENDRLVAVRRQLAWHPGSCEWTTVEVKLGNRFLVRDGRATSKASIGAKEPEPPPAGSEHDGEAAAPLATEEEPSLPLLTDSGGDGDGLPSGQQLASELQPPSSDIASELGTKLDADRLSPAASALLRQLSSLAKDAVRLVPAVRSSPGAQGDRTGVREPFISQEMQQALVKLHDSHDPQRIAQMDRIEACLEVIWPERWKLDFVAGELLVREQNLRFPIFLEGGGRQEYLGLALRLAERGCVFVVEEPEAHLHSRLRKELFALMQRTSQSSQVIVVTHSADLVDMTRPSANWLCEKAGRFTKVAAAQSKEDLRRALDILGAQPADRLYPNKVLMVPGDTEALVVPIWLDTLGVKADGLHVKVVALEGEQDWRTVNSWLERARETQTEAFLMVDNHGASLAERALREGLHQEHCLVLSGTVEDCYPIEILQDELSQWYDERGLRPDLDSGSPMVPQIQDFLKQKLNLPRTKTVWKKPIGEAVAKRMGQEDIPEEVRAFLSRLA